MEELNVIWILAVGLGLACLLGYTAQRFRLSPILGYLFAGYIIGPNFPGFVADPYISEQLANVGVTLLMFAVGLNFSWKDLIAVKRIALPGALILSFFSICAGIFLSLALGQTWAAGLVIGLAVCVSSTVVIVRILTDQNLLHTAQGHVVIGWTIVEDLVSVFGLILLPAIVHPSGFGDNLFLGLGYSILLVFLKIAVLGLIVYYIGDMAVEKLLKVIARTRSHELFTLALLTFVFFIAVGSSYVFGVSLALGAFIAGTVVGKTEVSHQAAANALPMRDTFAVIFFLSVGMLFNPIAIKDNLPLLFGLLSIILILRPLLAFFMINTAKYPLSVAATVAIAIAEIGEYSFILAEEGNQLQVLPDNAYDILVACAFISIMLNPLLFILFKRFTTKKVRKLLPESVVSGDVSLSSIYGIDAPEQSFLPLAIVVGYGPVGKAVSRYLLGNKYHVLVIDQNIDTVSSLKERGIEFLFGDAAQFYILEKANLANAKLIVISTPDFPTTRAIIQTAQQVNPYVKIIARSHFKSNQFDAKFGDIPIVYDEEAAAEKITHTIQTLMA